MEDIINVLITVSGPAAVGGYAVTAVPFWEIQAEKLHELIVGTVTDHVQKTGHAEFTVTVTPINA